MWLFTRLGFFSAVCARKDNGKSREIDPESIMVRARVKDHLLALKARFPKLLRGKIQTDTGTDYKYRIIVPKPIWNEVVATLSDDVDYGNFKGAVRDNEYHDALMRVWHVMNRMQLDEGKPSQPVRLEWPSERDWERMA